MSWILSSARFPLSFIFEYAHLVFEMLMIPVSPEILARPSAHREKRFCYLHSYPLSVQ